MAKKIQIVVNVEVKEEVLREEGVTIEDVKNDITLIEDDVVDAVLITRKGNLDDIGSTFFLDGNNSSIESIKIID